MVVLVLVLACLTVGMVVVGLLDWLFGMGFVCCCLFADLRLHFDFVGVYTCFGVFGFVVFPLV